ncbi:MAG: Type pilus assembly protein PilM [Candidatus Parcubacteria bacterium]|jgi:Tfp pilus assembly protein PilN
MVHPVASPRRTRKAHQPLDVSGMLQHQEQIGGLAITERGVSLVFASPSYKSDTASRVLFEKLVPLAEGTIVSGVLMKEAPLLQALQALKTKIKTKTHTNAKAPSWSVVVSLPARTAQPFLFELLPHLTTEETTNAVSLLIDASLPLPKEERYADWEEYTVSRTEGMRRRAMVAMGLKRLIDPYLAVIQKAGFVPVACETHAWSVLRSLEGGGVAPTMVLDLTASPVVVTAAEQGIPVFQFDMPRAQAETPEALARMLQRIGWFLLSDQTVGISAPSLVIVGLQEAHDAYQSAIQTTCGSLFSSIVTIPGTEDPAHTVAMGAAIRGLLARKDDHVTSFLSVGTEIAYTRQQLISFLWFVEKLCVTFGLFFIALLTGALLLMSAVSRTTAQALAIEQIGIDQNIAKMSESVNAVNQESALLAQLIRTTPQWERLFIRLDDVWTDGLSINRLDLTVGQPVNMGGIARNREDLLALRDALQSSSAFLPIALPLSVLVQKEQIPFNATLIPKENNLLLNGR